MSPSANFITDKVRLVYEFNSNSPLFARVAEAEIDRGNYAGAVEILEKGLAVYPEYTSAQIILALAKAYSGDSASALELARSAAGLAGSPQMFEFYKKKIESITARVGAENQAAGKSMTSPLQPEGSGLDIESRLDILAEKLKKARIVPKEDAPEISQPQYTGRIVTETLAEIYFTQKNYSEAIATYNELMLMKPEKISIYENRVEEIRLVMEGSGK